MDIRRFDRMYMEFSNWQIAEVPEWAYAEHMERIMPLKELHRTSSSSTGETILKKLIKRIGGNR